MKSKKIKKLTNSKDTKELIMEILRMVKNRDLIPTEAIDLIGQITTLQQSI